ncbi:DUF819 family protein [Hydrogenimonas cancrithermarum]|uniref:Membrane protein n=1 Tax=Hydrogenimonas cancrithermarum TaxID=2993563 RepID=A0ABM8FN27_9BACT|nr:DUF819 family protein [Hydrogenimonas cancrithermarum]BDY12884.1 membrane protein [Hydrogenimonas cancrithermarum]BDY13001.1 membrane protein [Hydrogenimonas cancrithermarum]
MIASPLFYLVSIASIAAVFGIAERFDRTRRYFTYLPAIVLIYMAAMVAAQTGLWERNEAIGAVYKTAKNNLLPAMLFLMLLHVDLRRFLKLGRPLLIAYVAATLSIGIAFFLVFWSFGFGRDEAGLFGALCGSWMGGTANMLAVGSALNVNETMMGYTLVVDAVDYTFWVMLLLSLVRIAPLFARWSGAVESSVVLSDLGCACTIGPKRYWLLLGTAFAVAIVSQFVGMHLGGLGTTTWTVLVATFAGLVGAYTPLSRINGSNELASTMLLLLVALIGSRADFADFGAVPRYIAAGAAILALHALMMAIVAKKFKLDLFSIAVASLANIGGVASAPILAGAYNRALIGIAVLMAIMGYLIGTFGGLLVGYTLRWIAS